MPSLSSVASELRPSFQVLDDVVRLVSSHGVLAVRVPEVAIALAAARHVERRAQAVGRNVFRAAQLSESPWRDVASRLGIRAHADDAAEVGRLLAVRASAEHAVLIAPLRARDAWGQAVVRACAEHLDGALLADGSGLSQRGGGHEQAADDEPAKGTTTTHDEGPRWG